MNDLLFSVFPNENFVDIGLYQYGWEHCAPAHSFGPAARNHYIFHYVISGTGTLMADNSAGETITYQVKSGQGFMLFPGQINTYIADTDFHLIGHTWLFLDYFMRSTETVRMKQDGSIRDFYIKEALSFIEQNFQNDISIEDIAACCGLNRSYFGKIFHDTIGRSPQEFLISYRMTKAAELLKITALSIADIGNAVGYPNQLHFSRAFKNVYGMSPRNWRMKNRLIEKKPPARK